MDPGLLLEQTLNGLQFGIMLFLMAAGLSVIFGIMNFINLTHGTLYMIGAFLLAAAYALVQNFYVGLVLALVAAVLLGAVLDRRIMQLLYDRSHLDQVLATFALLIFFNELIAVIWGVEPRFIPIPDALSGTISLPGDVDYPVYRLVITALGLLAAAVLYVIVQHTKLGMKMRAGATDREMLSGLGIDVRMLFTVVFCIGVFLAALAGMVTGPLVSVQVGMGEPMMIVAFVVVVVGGIGSIAGALASSLLIGLVDTMGRVLLPAWLGFTTGPALASMTIYVLMVGILLLRPQGLFGEGRL
jgi:branched-chain amino acid transport system permease protein